MPIPKIQEEALRELSPRSWIRPFRLVGGTALALQYEHRVSQDLDFFTTEPFQINDLIRELERTGAFTLKRKSEFTAIGTWQGAEVTFLSYQYPWIREAVPMPPLCAALAHPLDIGLMKIEAASQRGTRRDFVDLFFICRRETSLEKLLELYPKKYGKQATPLYHILKSLSYFEDAEGQPEIRTQPRTSWKEIRSFFEKEVSRLAKILLKS